MAINGKTLTVVEGLVTATDTSEGDFRTGMDDVLFQVNENEETASVVSDEQDRLYTQIRALRAGDWNYISWLDDSDNSGLLSVTIPTISAASRLSYFGETVAERAGRYMFMVIGGSGGVTFQSAGAGSGAGGMIRFEYIWDGVTAMDWRIPAPDIGTVLANRSTVLTTPTGFVATGGGGANNNQTNGDGVLRGGGNPSHTGSQTGVSNIVTAKGGRGGVGVDANSGGGGAVNVFALTPDDGTQTAGGAAQGGTVFGSGQINEFGVAVTNDGDRYAVKPGGYYMGRLPASSATVGSNGGHSTFREGLSNFGGGGTGTDGFPGLFGGVGPNARQAANAMIGGSGVGHLNEATLQRGMSGVIAWCRMGAE